MERRGPQQNLLPQCGVVTSVNEQYRVKVFPPLMGLETDFIRVGSQYVGAGWGYGPGRMSAMRYWWFFRMAISITELWSAASIRKSAIRPRQRGQIWRWCINQGPFSVLTRQETYCWKPKGVLTLNGAKVNIN